jgi:hypothetical protein
LDPAWLQTYIHRQKQVDDVFDAAFLNGIIFTGSKEPQGLVAAQLRELLDMWGTAWSKHMVEDSPKQPCPGLYVWKNNALWNVYRMYDDFNGAFMASTRRCSATGYVQCLTEKRPGSLIAHISFQQIFQSTCWWGRVPDSERNSSISHGNLAHKTEATGRPSVRGQGHVQD